MPKSELSTWRTRVGECCCSASFPSPRHQRGAIHESAPTHLHGRDHLDGHGASQRGDRFSRGRAARSDERRDRIRGAADDATRRRQAQLRAH
eukprot:scaffold64_cov248-Pinguiococcus_pyrenoidosus.AAC.11